MSDRQHYRGVVECETRSRDEYGNLILTTNRRYTKVYSEASIAKAQATILAKRLKPTDVYIEQAIEWERVL